VTIFINGSESFFEKYIYLQKQVIFLPLFFKDENCLYQVYSRYKNENQGIPLIH